MIVVDLNTRIVNSDHNVFVVRPGKEYRLFEDFIKSELIFPDLPGLELRSGVPLSEYKDLPERIRRSNAIKSWYNRDRPEDDVPPRNLDHYSGRHRTASQIQLEAVLRGYFEKAAQGDLVIVPPRNYKANAYIGELVGPPSEIVEAPLRLFPGEMASSRRVRWLAQMAKRSLPLPILDALEHPNAIYLLERSLREDIYQAAYGNFTLGLEQFSARFDVKEQTFTVDDELQLQAFFKFVAVNTRILESGTKARIQRIGQSTFQNGADYVPSLQTNINSPGELSLFCKRITPLVAAALFAIAVDIGPDGFGEAFAGEVTLRNSKSTVEADPCVARVEEQVRTQLQMLGLDGWPEACEIARGVHQRTQVRSPAKAAQR